MFVFFLFLPLSTHTNTQPTTWRQRRRCRHRNMVHVRTTAKSRKFSYAWPCPQRAFEHSCTRATRSRVREKWSSFDSGWQRRTPGMYSSSVFFFVVAGLGLRTTGKARAAIEHARAPRAPWGIADTAAQQRRLYTTKYTMHTTRILHISIKFTVDGWALSLDWATFRRLLVADG